MYHLPVYDYSWFYSIKCKKKVQIKWQYNLLNCTNVLACGTEFFFFLFKKNPYGQLNYGLLTFKWLIRSIYGWIKLVFHPVLLEWRSEKQSVIQTIREHHAVKKGKGMLKLEWTYRNNPWFSRYWMKERCGILSERCTGGEGT